MKILTEKERLVIAETISLLAHSTQKDKAGEPYSAHCRRVANACKSVEAKIVAYLHDVVEDKHMSHKDLEIMGCFTGHELYCLRLLDKTYNGGSLSLEHLINRFEDEGYIENIKSVPVAREVKIADIKDNMDISRFIRNGIQIEEKDMERLKKYANQLAYLEQ